MKASVWGSASSNLSWASKAASIGVATPAVNVTNSAATPQPKSKQNHQSGNSSLVTSSQAPWGSTVSSNNGSGGFWDEVLTEERFKQVQILHRNGLASGDAIKLKIQAKTILSHVLNPGMYRYFFKRTEHKKGIYFLPYIMEKPKKNTYYSS